MYNDRKVGNYLNIIGEIYIPEGKDLFFKYVHGQQISVK